jgi:hypothetical protein
MAHETRPAAGGAAVTPEDVKDLKEFGLRIARLTPEQEERRKWAKWIERLRRLEDPLSWEATEDRRDGDTYW